MDADFDKMAKDGFYLTADMVKFLLIENLALKLVLHKNNLLKLEDFAKHRQDASDIMDKTANEKIEEWKKANPQMVELFRTIKTQQGDPVQSEDQPVVS